MVLGISGSGKKEGTQPHVKPRSSPRKISASPTESLPCHVAARAPRSAPATTDLHHALLLDADAVPAEQRSESEFKPQSSHSPSMRDWNVFENPLGLRDDASAAAAFAQVALMTADAPSIAVHGAASGIGTSDGCKVASKNSPLQQPRSKAVDTQKQSKHELSSVPSQTRLKQNHNPGSSAVSTEGEVCATHATPRMRIERNAPDSPSAVSTRPARGEESAVGAKPPPCVADLVAVYESAASRDGRSSAAASPSVAHKKSSPVPRVAASKSDHHPKLSPRSSAAAAASTQQELRAASESAVKSGSSSAILQLYPQNAAWNQSTSAVVREFYADATVHAAPPPAASSPKSKSQPEVKALMKTPLKTSAADRVRTPAVSDPSVRHWFALAALACSRCVLILSAVMWSELFVGLGVYRVQPAFRVVYFSTNAPV
jgi:hypothetical protein